MKHLVFISALLCALLPLKAQNEFNENEFQAKYRAYREYPDSIRIEFPSVGAFVVINEKNIQKNDSIFTRLPQLLNDLVADLEKGLADTSIPHHIKVTYLPNRDRKMMATEKHTNSTEILSRNNQVIQLLPNGWEMEITLSRGNIYIYAPNFESLKALSSQNFSLIQENMNKELSTDLYRNSLTSRLVVRDNVLQSHKHERTGVQDILSFNIGAGFGFTADKYHPFTKGTLTISLRDRSNIYRHMIEVSATTSFYTFKNSDGNLYSKASNFIDLSYNFNTASGNKKASWFGFGAGILTTKRQNFFTEKTARFFLNKSIGNFEFSPQLYLTNDYKDRLMGLGVSYSF
jgi:hypothetical protein